MQNTYVIELIYAMGKVDFYHSDDVFVDNIGSACRFFNLGDAETIKGKLESRYGRGARFLVSAVLDTKESRKRAKSKFFIDKSGCCRMV